MRKDANLFKSDDSINELLDIAYAFQKSRMLISAGELGIFDAIGEEYKTADQLAIETNTDPKALQRLMNSLVTMKLLLKKDGKYGNSRIAWNCLVKGNQYYLGSLDNFSATWDKWSNLTEVVRTGKPVDFVEIKDRTHEQLEDLIESMHWMGSHQAVEVIKMLEMKKVVRVLDLGGGSGAYAMEFLRNFPNLDVAIFDLPQIIEITRKYLEVKGFDGKIVTIPGDVTKDKLPKNHYDIIFISHLLHMFSFWENMEILKNIYDALKIGGRIIIHEMMFDDGRTSPEVASTLSLYMLLNTKTGELLTESELWILLKEAWFSKIERKDTSFGTSVVTAVK